MGIENRPGGPIPGGDGSDRIVTTIQITTPATSGGTYVDPELMAAVVASNAICVVSPTSATTQEVTVAIRGEDNFNNVAPVLAELDSRSASTPNKE